MMDFTRDAKLDSLLELLDRAMPQLQFSDTLPLMIRYALRPARTSDTARGIARDQWRDGAVSDEAVSNAVARAFRYSSIAV